MSQHESGVRSSPEARFISSLQGLERGDLAVLKRNAGNTVASSRGALPVFYRIVPRSVIGGYDEDIYFLVATLFGHNAINSSGNFGDTMAAVRKVAGSDSIDKRMSVLLDSELTADGEGRLGGGEMAYRLRQCVKLAHSKGVGINWTKLLEDLRWWSHPSGRVRKQWARSYFGATSANEEKE